MSFTPQRATADTFDSIHSPVTDSYRDMPSVRPQRSPVPLSPQFAKVLPCFISQHVQEFIDTRLIDYNVSAIESKITAESSIEQVAKTHDWLTPPLKPEATTSFAVVLMADVSGYSKLTALLAERGNTGTEILSRTMKGYLDNIVDIIKRHQGDIVKFAGDAVVAYWKIDCAPEALKLRSSMACICETRPWEKCDCIKCMKSELVMRACLCCVELLKKLGDYKIAIQNCDISELHIHLGVGAGQMYDVHVFGNSERWEHFMAGDAVNQLQTVLDRAQPSQLGVSTTAWELLSRVVDSSSIEVLKTEKDCTVLLASNITGRRISWPPLKRKLSRSHIPFDLRVSLYKKYINHAVISKLLSGYDDLMAMNELRQLTTVFIHLGDLKFTSALELAQTQSAMESVQRAMTKYEGSLRQFHVDDKGATILAFFGLPPLAHENDAAYGLKAAIEIAKDFLKFKSFSIGVTTGTVAIGGVGNKERTEYALFGDSINIAARLMFHEAAKRAIVCDERTFKLCHRDFKFGDPVAATVKGKTKPISLYTVAGSGGKRNNNFDDGLTHSDRSFELFVKNLDRTVLAGRKKEKTFIKTALEEYFNGDHTVLVVEGDAGAGLSTFFTYLKQEATDLDVLYDLMAAVIKLQVASIEDLSTERRVVPDENYDNSKDAAFSSTQQRGFVVKSQTFNAVSAMLSGAVVEENEDDVELLSPTYRRSISEHAKISSTKSLQDIIMAQNDKNEIPELYELTASKYLDTSIVTTKYAHSSLIISRSETTLEERFREMLLKLGENPHQSSLFDSVFPHEFVDISSSGIFRERSTLRELFDLILRIFNVISTDIPMLLIIEESQWADHVTWSLIEEICNGVPNLMMCVFSRSQRQYESSSVDTFKNIKGLSHCRTLEIGGFVIEELPDLLMLYWNHMITSAGSSMVSATCMSPVIVEKMHQISGGNPLFSKSLLFSLFESGLLTVDKLGQVTLKDCHDGKPFDFDAVLPGLDLQSVVISQFDKLDYRFQQLLKVACVIGEQFLIEDAIYFVSKSMQTDFWADNLRLMDKYDFLKCQVADSATVTYSFKSSMIRKTIYTMMHEEQRMKLHHDLAEHFEKLLDLRSRARLLVPIYEHYCEANNVIKTKQYLEEVAHFFYETHDYDQCIKHYLKLLSFYNGSDKFTLHKSASLTDTKQRRVVASWYRELGESYYLWEKSIEEAKRYLILSCKELGYKFPQGKVSVFFEHIKQLWLLKRSNPDLTCYCSEPDDLIELRMTLASLGQVLSRGNCGSVKQYETSLLAALNVSSLMPVDGGHAVLKATAATFMWRHVKHVFQVFDMCEDAEDILQIQLESDINQCSAVAASMGMVFLASGFVRQALRKYSAVVKFCEIVEDSVQYYTSVLQMYWIEWLLCKESKIIRNVQGKCRLDMNEHNTRRKMPSAMLQIVYHLHHVSLDGLTKMSNILDTIASWKDINQFNAGDLIDNVNYRCLALAVEIELLSSASSYAGFVGRYDVVESTLDRISAKLCLVQSNSLKCIFGICIVSEYMVKLFALIERQRGIALATKIELVHYPTSSVIKYLKCCVRFMKNLRKVPLAVLLRNITITLAIMYQSFECRTQKKLYRLKALKAFELVLNDTNLENFPRFRVISNRISEELEGKRSLSDTADAKIVRTQQE